jgi:hypothetical protein
MARSFGVGGPTHAILRRDTLRTLEAVNLAKRPRGGEAMR